MSLETAYLMVGVVAAIAAGEEVGIVGMMMMLIAWPVFVLAGLAVHGFPLTPLLMRQPPQIPAGPDLREARLRGQA